VWRKKERERDRCTRAHVYYNNNRLQRDGCASPIHHKCHMPAAQSGFCINLRAATFYKPNGPFYFIFFSILFFFPLKNNIFVSLSLSLSIFLPCTHFRRPTKQKKKMKNKKNCILKWHKDNRRKRKKKEREKRIHGIMESSYIIFKRKKQNLKKRVGGIPRSSKNLFFFFFTSRSSPRVFSSSQHSQEYQNK
jgi:hypothetical protein